MGNLSGEYGWMSITMPIVVHYGIKKRQLEILQCCFGPHYKMADSETVHYILNSAAFQTYLSLTQ